MRYQFPPGVDELVQKHLATGHYVSEDEVLRDALQTLDAERQKWAAIEEGLSTLDQGEKRVSLPTGQNIGLHGLLGVIMSSFQTCSALIDINSVLTKIKTF